jgi:hypothetical protein
MDQVALNARQEKLVKQVAEELFVEPTEAGCMLRHFGYIIHSHSSSCATSLMYVIGFIE